MNLSFSLPLFVLPKCITLLAACACLSAPLAMSQTLTTGTPVMLNQACPSCDVLSAELFLDPAGDVFASWNSQEITGDRRTRAKVARYSVSSGKWGASPIGLPTEADEDVQIGYDGRGNALATWRIFFEGASTYYYSTYSGAQRSWSRPVLFWDPREGAGVELKVGPSGDAIIEGSSRGGQPLFRFDPATRTVRENGTGQIDTDFALDPKGNAIHLSVDRAWSASVPQHVYAMRFDAATQRWHDRVKLDPDFQRDDDISTDYPVVVMDRNGNGMGLWTYEDNVNGIPFQMGSVRYLARTGKFTVKKIPVTGNGTVYGGSITTDSASNVYAVWSQQMEGQLSKVVFAKYSSTTGQWSAPRVIQTGTSMAWNPKIAADNKGNVVAAWIQRNSAGKYVQTAARYSIAASTWGKPVTVQRNTDVSSYRTRIVVDNNGHATLVWLQEGLPVVNGSPTFKLMAARLSF